MKTLLFLLTFATITIIGCNSYGDKIKVNDKSEVYYKDGANKEEAQKLGDFLLKNNYFDTKSQKSVQLTKTKDTFNVKFVVDKGKVAEEKNAEFLFQILGYAMSAQVFNNMPVKVILADQYMKGFKDIAITTSDSKDMDSTTAEDTSMDSTATAK